MEKNITPHFTLHELTTTTYDFDNSVKPSHEANLRYIAHKLELIRSALDKPLYIESCYRTPAVNRAAGGSPTSLHLVGLAVDLKVHNITYKQMPRFLQAVLSTCPYEIKINSLRCIHIAWLRGAELVSLDDFEKELDRLSFDDKSLFNSNLFGDGKSENY